MKIPRLKERAAYEAAITDAEQRLTEIEQECEALKQFVAAGKKLLAASAVEQKELPLGPQPEFAGMTLLSAARVYLEKVGEPQTPDSIGRGLLDGGFVTTSKNLPLLLRPALNKQRQRAEQKGETPTIIKLNGGWGLPGWEEHPSKGKH